jgi:perosamine synthetase
MVSSAIESRWLQGRYLQRLMQTRLNIDSVVAAVRRAAKAEGPVALHEPEFCGNEKSYLGECIDTTFVSSVGKFVDRFEAMLSERTGSRYAIACVNGTVALQVALQLAGVGPGDEVIVPAMSFVATANSVSHLGAVPHFVDSDVRTLGLSAAALSERLEAVGERNADNIVRNVQTGQRIAAIVPMHTFGHPVDLANVMAVADRWGLPVVEDAAESLGTLYRNRHTGTFGLLAALSFNGNKIITTGGGGAILTDDKTLARRAKHLTTTAKLPHRWEFNHDEVGYNFRLPNLNAALGCAQLEQLDGFVDRKRSLADRYREALADISGVRLFVEPEGARSNYWLNTLLLNQDEAGQRDQVLSALNAAGLMARPAWTLLHRLPMYEQCPRGTLAVAEDLVQRIINVPSSSRLVNG